MLDTDLVSRFPVSPTPTLIQYVSHVQNQITVFSLLHLISSWSTKDQMLNKPIVTGRIDQQRWHVIEAKC